MKNKPVIGDEVIVIPSPDDMFNHEFVGIVAKWDGQFYVVRDQDDCRFTVEPEQVELTDDQQALYDEDHERDMKRCAD